VVPVRKVVLMNASDPGEIRVAILENGELAEIFMERKSRGQQAGNIYKGRVVNVEPSLQAAFVDLGTERNGFLHASDCIPPDGGYGDILTKLPPGARPQRPEGRDSHRRDPRDSRDSRGPQGHGEQHRRHSPGRHEHAQRAPAPATPGSEPVQNSAPLADATPASATMPESSAMTAGTPLAAETRPLEALLQSTHPASPVAPGDAVDSPTAAAGISTGQPVQSGNPLQQGQDSGRRRRRRRGGRGRSGRARPPGPAPMIAPGQSGQADENRATSHSEQPHASPETATPTADNAATSAPQAQETPAAVAVPSAVEQPPLGDSPAAPERRPEERENPAPSQSASETPAALNGEEPAQRENSNNSSEDHSENAAKSDANETDDVEVEKEEETQIDTDDVPAAPAEGDWQEHPVGEEVASTEIVDAPDTGSNEKTNAPSVREAAPIPAPGQPAPAFQHRQGGGRSGRERPHDRRYTIQEMLREGQEVLVQVAKEGIGQKGPALTTYLSMPGRYLVLMPAVQRLGVSKRIENEEQRRALKDALAQLNPPEDMGIIVRTAGTGRNKDELQRDMDYLMRVWDTLKKKAKVARAPAQVYQEGDVVTRVFRDVITDDVAEIVIDDPIIAERAREFLRETSPGTEHKVRLYADAEPLFHKQGVEQQLQRLFNRKVNLRSGGSIVIEQTEALVAIDVNTGRFREKRSQDDTILATNLEAAREIARQLRLRDIGGLVMIDFIDMEPHDHRRRVERELKAHLARDKARINVLPISSLGVVEMTRQRIRHSLRKTLFDRCPHCSGSGHVKSAESLGLEILREVKGQLRDPSVKRVRVLVNSMVAFDILNQFRKDLARLEESRGITVEVRGDGAVPLSQIQVSTAKEGGEWVVKKISEVDDYVRNS
jgi:ribonuclease E